jgi:hypothetical protein
VVRPCSAVDDLDAFFERLRLVDAEEGSVDVDLDLVHGNWAVSDGLQSAVPQAEAMVLSLDDPFESTAVVLELELGRMGMEELEDFEARMDKASIASCCAAG